MSRKSPKLPLTDEERSALRKEKIRLGDIFELYPDVLSERLNISMARARYLVGMSIFQRIPSIGPNMAHNVVEDLGFHSYEDIKDEKGEEMHKSKGNAIWFDEAVEKIGADPDHVVEASLVHGNRVAIVTGQDAGMVIDDIDGLVTNKPGVFLPIQNLVQEIVPYLNSSYVLPCLNY